MIKKLTVILSALFFLASCENNNGQKAYFSIEDNISQIVIGQDAYSKSFTVHSNTEWQFVTMQKWAKVSPAKGKGDGKITVMTGASIMGRTATFTIKVNGAPEQQFAIIQGDVYAPSDDEEFPIVAWAGINANESAAKFPAMKAAGINIYLGWYDNLATVQSVLDAATVAGVKVICSSPELKNNTEAAVQATMNHPALYGYYLDDEPEVSDIDMLSDWMQNIQAVDGEHPCYINLYPMWAWGGSNKYESNVATFLDKVPVPFLSFDIYPIVSINGAPTIIRSEWYQNLEIIAAAAKNKNIPFWAFALALSHNLDASHFYPIPTVAELRLQMFSNLAYGAQGLQYFTYWGIYHEAPTIVHDRVKTVNQEIRNLTSVFLGANVISVGHTAPLPTGTHPVGTLPDHIKSLNINGGAVVSLLEKNNNQYLVIVNRDYRNSMQMTITVDSSVGQVLKDGMVIPVSGSNVTVDAGDMVIYTWSK
jgi:hypothetical protein